MLCLSFHLDPIEVGGTRSILSEAGLFFHPSKADEVIQRPLDGAAGQAQFLCNGVDGVPAFTTAIGTIPQIQADDLGSGRHLPVIIDGIKEAHDAPPFLLVL